MCLYKSNQLSPPRPFIYQHGVMDFPDNPYHHETGASVSLNASFPISRRNRMGSAAAFLDTAPNLHLVRSLISLNIKRMLVPCPGPVQTVTRGRLSLRLKSSLLPDLGGFRLTADDFIYEPFHIPHVNRIALPASTHLPRLHRGACGKTRLLKLELFFHGNQQNDNALFFAFPFRLEMSEFGMLGLDLVYMTQHS